MQLWGLSSNNQPQQQQQVYSEEDTYVKENNSDDTSTMSTFSEGSNNSSSNNNNNTNTTTAVTSTTTRALGGILDSCDILAALRSGGRGDVGGAAACGAECNDTATVITAEGDATEVYVASPNRRHRQQRHHRHHRHVVSYDEDDSCDSNSCDSSLDDDEPLSLEEQRNQLLQDSKKLLRTRGFSIRQQLQQLIQHESATLLQAQIRGLIAKNRYQEQVAAAKFIQLFYRIEYQQPRHQAACKIQSFFQVHTEYYRLYRIGASIMIQSVVRRALTVNKMAKQQESALRIQATVRSFLACLLLKKARQGVIAVQAAHRGMVSRQQLLDMEYDHSDHNDVDDQVDHVVVDSDKLNTTTDTAATTPTLQEEEEAGEDQEAPLQKQEQEQEQQEEAHQVQGVQDEEEDDEYDDDEEETYQEEEGSLVTYEEEDGSLVTYEKDEGIDHHHYDDDDDDFDEDDDDDDLPIEELDDEDRHRDGWFEELLQDIVGDFEDTWKEMTLSEPAADAAAAKEDKSKSKSKSSKNSKKSSRKEKSRRQKERR